MTKVAADSPQTAHVASSQQIFESPGGVVGRACGAAGSVCKFGFPKTIAVGVVDEGAHPPPDVIRIVIATAPCQKPGEPCDTAEVVIVPGER